MILKFTVPGEPKAKARPRMMKTGFVYTPKDTVNYENLVKMCFMEQCNKKVSGEVEAIIKAYFAIPKSVSKTKREAMVHCVVRPIKKPDGDNIAKAILDSVNKIAYDDDSQVVTLTVEKYYSESPRVEVELRGD